MKTRTSGDGNPYKTVKIGDQEWMAENLNTSQYRNGDKIPEAKTDAEWQAYGKQGTGAWCYYDNDPANGKKYGKLYNWYAVNDPRGLAPEGWHVPSDAGWQTLIDYLGGLWVAGGKMKERGTVHWSSTNTGATNESGFSALPGGYCHKSGKYKFVGMTTDFWSSTESGTRLAPHRYLYSSSSEAVRLNHSKHSGFSVRCVRD